ncbi:MAG: hypothetical protein ACRD29_03725 [Acidimicrobiales bacterium]
MARRRRQACGLPAHPTPPTRPSMFRRAWRRLRRRPRLAGPARFDDPGGFGPPDAGVREPRTPRPTVGAGAMALPLSDRD